MGMEINAMYRDSTDTTKIIVSGVADGDVTVTLTDLTDMTIIHPALMDTPDAENAWEVTFPNTLVAHDYEVDAERDGKHDHSYLDAAAPITDWRIRNIHVTPMPPPPGGCEALAMSRVRIVSEQRQDLDGTVRKGRVRVELMLMPDTVPANPRPARGRDQGIRIIIARTLANGNWGCVFTDVPDGRKFVVRLSDASYVWNAKKGTT